MRCPVRDFFGWVSCSQIRTLTCIDGHTAASLKHCPPLLVSSSARPPHLTVLIFFPEFESDSASPREDPSFSRDRARRRVAHRPCPASLLSKQSPPEVSRGSPSRPCPLAGWCLVWKSSGLCSFCVTIRSRRNSRFYHGHPLKILERQGLRRGSWAGRVYDRTDSFSVPGGRLRLGAAPGSRRLVGPWTALSVPARQRLHPGIPLGEMGTCLVQVKVQKRGRSIAEAAFREPPRRSSDCAENTPESWFVPVRCLPRLRAPEVGTEERSWASPGSPSEGPALLKG